jgi:hypothetical protein
MNRLFALTLAVPLLAAATARGDDLAAGTWAVTSLTPDGSKESTNWLLKVESTGGNATATLAAANPAYKDAAVKSFTVKGDNVRVVLFNGFGEVVFEGKVAGKNGMKVVGVLGADDVIYPAWMAPTDLTALAKADLIKPTSAAGGLVALAKLRTMPKGADADDLARWADAASKDAAVYGPAWQASANATIATALLRHPGQAGRAVQYAEVAERSLDEAAPPARRIKVLEALALALQSAGKDDGARRALEQVAKLDTVLDKAYLAEGLPFKPDVFAGRKTDSRRAVVLELFTGAQCPPCVAADLAFEGLQKTYKPAELVLVQYHLHIPGPDPMTNSDTEARWKHYQKAFGKKIGGVPTAIVNGKGVKVGGGGSAFAGKLYAGYRDMIDPLLDTPAACEVKATARRQGEQVDIQAEVTGLANPGTDKKLRLLLVEELVRYAGSNKIRMHHHVVRAMPGGADGQAITEKDSQVKASVVVPELRKTLTGYLDDFVATRGPLPRAIRPMEMHDLRVVAFVQDDATQEILQAVEVEVTGP